ncbi:MAG: DUF4340 domain-containing protein [Planctomycetia bacterium]|nr:DUF4340 domain-containing protein [Planctomycetia bacterium]
MNLRLTIAVLLVLIVLVGVVAYVNRQPHASTSPAKHHYVFLPHPTALDRFSFKSAHGPQLAFKRVGTHWFIVSPIKARGRDYAIGDLAGTLADLQWRYRARIASRGHHTLAHTGLEKPKAVLTVVNQAGKTFTLNIGSLNATGRLYVHLAGVHDPYIDIVKADWLRRLERPVRKFRNRSLTSFHTRNIAAITLRTDSGTMRLVPQGKTWAFNQPLPAPADKSKVTTWISNLQLLTAHRFANIPAARAGLTHGPLTITVDFKAPHPLVATPNKNKTAPVKTPPAPAPLVIQFGIKTDLTGKFLYAQSSYNPGVCVVRNTSFQQLHESFAALRDYHLLAAGVSKASHIVITRRNGITGNTPATLTLARTHGQWQILEAANRNVPAGTGAVTKLLADVHTVTAKRFLDKPTNMVALGLTSPSATWKITIPDHVHPITLTFGAVQHSGLIPVKVSPWPSIYMVSPVAIKPLLPQLTSLRGKKVTDLAAANPRRITIRRAGTTVTIHKVKGRWLRGSTPAPAGAVNNLLSAWRPLRAKKWFINMRSVSSVPPIIVDLALRHAVKPALPTATPANKKKPSTPSKMNYIWKHDVLTLWRITLPKSPRSTVKGKTSAPAPTFQWRAELSETGVARGLPVWSFQPHGSLVSAVQTLLKK